MNILYINIFEQLLKSYNEGNFEDTVRKILNESDMSKKKLLGVISHLCGVNINVSPEEDDDTYIKNLKTAINANNSLHKDTKIVNKISMCGSECSSSNAHKCKSVCPFDAIFINPEDNNAYLDEDKCTDCGKCVEVCKEGNIIDKIQYIPLVELLKSNTPVIATVAPAIRGQFGEDVTMNQLRTAFIEIGFADMVEVAFFADMLSIKEAVEFDHLVKDDSGLLITSCCCPMWIGMIKRNYNDLIDHVSPSLSPMSAASRVMKTLNPDCKVVFAGPCIAKKAEAKDSDIAGLTDYVLTFEELKVIFDTLNIDPSTLPETETIEYSSKGGRIYGRTGGVSMAVEDIVKEMFPNKAHLFKSVKANGVKECKELLNKALNKEIDARFMEGMGCVGGCVGGPKALISKERGRELLDEFAFASEIQVPTNSETMKVMLSKIGIDSLDDFKDREKAKIFERNFNL